MSNGKKFSHTFTTSLDTDDKKAGKVKTTHAVYDFEGVTEDDLIQIAIRHVTIKEQGRMRKNWHEVKDGQKVTWKVKERMGRMLGAKALTVDSAAEYISSLSDEERERFMAEVAKRLGKNTQN